ncbi:MAG TPA: PQQ-binding-like beta-propeller repeat protein [Acidimicrobiales bacterium]|nr:PQQ-binding-like beta-propeller repeat protein [Acidimicrobiales bacterium]
MLDRWMRTGGRVVTGAVTAALVAGMAGGACSPGSKRLASKASTTSSTARAGATTSSSPPAGVTAGWTTYFGDAGRSGVAADGPAAPRSVRRQWASGALDGDVYAQPLIVRDRVIVATGNDTVYALDAATGAIVWSRHLGTPVPSSSLPCGDVDPVGITSTPVVDPAAGRVYVVGMAQPAHHTLFDLDLATGSVVASAGADAPGADPTTHNQRGALSLDGGTVLVPFGGRFGDCGSYHGQLVAVPSTPTGLGPPTAYTLPTGREGGFWAPPGPVTASDGSIYLASGNSASRGTYDYGNSVVHLSAALKLVDSFAPADWAALNSTDSDLGSTSPVLVGGNRVFQIGKAGTGYLLDGGRLGGVGGQLSSAKVCSGPSLGGVSHTGTTLFVPCPGGVEAVDVTADRVVVRWASPASTPGPPIATTGAVWTVATGSGELAAIDPVSGGRLISQQIGRVPSRFTSPAAGGGRVVVAAGRTVMAFGD